MEDTSERSTRTNSISRKILLRMPRHQHLSLLLHSVVQVYGSSMYPTLNHTGDVVLVERLSTRLGKIEQGDMVLVRSPENPNKTVTKRVLGLEGDRVTFIVDPRHSEDTATIVVPKGKVWIQGDNIYASRDSRHFGPVPYGLLEGKVFYRFTSDGKNPNIGKNLTHRSNLDTVAADKTEERRRFGQSMVLELWNMGCGSDYILKVFNPRFACSECGWWM